MTTSRSFWLLAVLAFATPALQSAAPKNVTFEKEIRPILKAHCLFCHGEEEKPKGKLDLRLPSLMKKGGRSGPALVAGKPEESLLWERVDNDDMPKGGKKLKPQEKEILKKWIAQGAKTLRPEPANPDDLRITEEERRFWAFQPVEKPIVPQVGVPHPIDAFLRAKLTEKGLEPSPEADRATLVRRAYFDLLGLPPTPEQVAAFVNDNSVDAWERLLDRLLASPHYGERWGRHWLDVAGYAESDGVTSIDKPRPYAWRYREYVVNSFNADKPFDRFVREQLAGDEMVKPPYANLSPADADKLAATAFLRMGPDATETDNTPTERNQAVAETIKIVSTALLGLTVGCAQCHDHRYDPISQQDYYRLRAVFDPAFDLQHWRKPSERRVSLWTDKERKKAQIVETIAKTYEWLVGQVKTYYVNRAINRLLHKTAPASEHPVILRAYFTPKAKRSKEQQVLVQKHKLDVIRKHFDLFDGPASRKVEKLLAKAAVIRSLKPPEAFLPATTEIPGRVPESRVFRRGDVEQPKQTVTPAELAILALHRPSADLPAKDPSLPTTGRRTAYAKLLADGKHPLTARVFVNRVWMHHFGKGIVATAGDFGAFGERPTHPELLDWLASDFVEHGWKIKRLHKLLMTSHAYKQTSRWTPLASKIDPDNRLLSRANVRRLEAEVIRDSILACSGKLNRTMHGPSVSICEGYDGLAMIGKRPVEPNGMYWGNITSVGEQEFRRSIYIEVRRRLPLPMLDVFDLPPMKPNCDVRRLSTVAPQSLLVLNNEFMLQRADDLAASLNKEVQGDSAAKVRRAWELLYAAPPTESELADALAFLKDQEKIFRTQDEKSGKKASDQQAAARALSSLCQVLFGSNRFLYVD